MPEFVPVAEVEKLRAEQITAAWAAFDALDVRDPRNPVLVRVSPEMLELLKSGEAEPVVLLGIEERGDGTYDMFLRTPLVRERRDTA